LGKSLVEGGFKCKEELGLSNVRNPGLDEERDFGIVYLLQDAITTNIERLGKMRGMGR
jgi:hypothetical protein